MPRSKVAKLPWCLLYFAPLRETNDDAFANVVIRLMKRKSISLKIFHAKSLGAKSQRLLWRLLYFAPLRDTTLGLFTMNKSVGGYHFIMSSIFLSLGILPVSSSIRISFASCRKSEAKIKSLRRWFLLKMISLLVPSHSLRPWYMYRI